MRLNGLICHYTTTWANAKRRFSTPETTRHRVVWWLRWGGGRKENSIKWDHVYSAAGGRYDLTIHYLPAEKRGLEVLVNGKSVIISELLSAGGMATVTLPVTLFQGDNCIELTCQTMWMPDIDKIGLKKIER